MKVSEQHPPRHRKSLVLRDGTLFTATPCYGMHEPWWVVKTMDGEAEPVPFRDDDEWFQQEAVQQLTAPADTDVEAALQSSIESAVQATSRYVALDDEADAVLKNQLRVRLLPLLRRGRANDVEPRSVPLNIVATGEVIYRKETGDE